MNGFEEVAFKPLFGAASIPFADEDTSNSGTINTAGQCHGEESEDRLITGRFRGPLIKSCTESSVPSGARRFGVNVEALRKSRTDGCVPMVQIKFDRSSAVQKLARHNESSPKSKSTNSIDAQSVNNILDQYEELDYSRSSEQSDAGSVDVDNFEATMNLRKQREANRLIGKTNEKSNGIQTRQRFNDRQQDPMKTERNVRANAEVEILLRKGEVQKRVDEWLSQTQGQNSSKPGGIKERGASVQRSNSSSCYRYRGADGRSKPRAANEAKETLNVAVSCDELSNDKDDERIAKTEPKQTSILDRTAGGTGMGMGNAFSGRSSYLKEQFVAARSRAGKQEQSSTSTTTGATSFSASRIPQRGTFAARKTETAVRNSGDVASDRDRTRNCPLVVPTRRSSLKRAVPSNGVPDSAGGKPWAGNAKGLAASGLVAPTSERPALPNKDRESRRPLIAGEDIRGEAGSQRNVETLRVALVNGEERLGLREVENAEETVSKTVMSQVNHRVPPIPRKIQSSNYVKCSRLTNPVSSFKPNNAMYATLQGDEEIAGFATSVGSESVTRSHYAAPKQIEKIYERPQTRAESAKVIHADDLAAILSKSSMASGCAAVSAYGDKTPAINSRVFFGQSSSPSSAEEFYAKVGESGRCVVDALETIIEDQRKESRSQECRSIPGLRGLGDFEERFGTAGQKPANGNAKALETIYASPRSKGLSHSDDQSKSTFSTFRSPSIAAVEDDETSAAKPIEPSCKKMSETSIEPEIFTQPSIPPINVDFRAEDKEEGNAAPALTSGAKNGVKERAQPPPAAPVVNAVLMKTLRFEQDIPPTGSFNSRDVLSNDYYDNVLLQESLKAKEEKLYVTKEEMEHEKLMNLLRKGDFEAAKSELERSYTLSTPGGGSPICCPPCSPPPAPTAYISSARASSRRLGAGGPSSPERDPLGRLLRFLKTFYRELGTRDPPHLPSWAAPLPLGTLCPAHFQPHLQLIHKSEQEHRLENIKLDQIFAPVRLSDGTVSEAPRRVAIEGGPGSGRTTLCLRFLHQWATQPEGGGGSPALALIVPLRELRGVPLLSYLSRELLPRTSALGDAVAQVWRTLHLMEDRVLFVLDGYDECVGGRASLGDAIDLLEGRLFPDARILVTCSPKNSPALSPLVQRRVNLAGLEWPHVERLCAAYFIHNDIAERVRDFLEALNSQPQPVRQLGQHPLGWLMLCSLYQDSGHLPEETSALVQAAVKCIVKRSLDPPVSCGEEIPAHCRKRMEDFGRLALAALREGRCCYTEAELRARGGGLEVTRLGFLTRGLTFGQRRKPDLFTPIHAAVAEFLAAYYLTSVAQYANILRRELEGLPAGIIGHLAGLLGPKTHLILNQLCPLEVPPRAVFSLLKSAGASDGNIAAVCRLVGAGPGFGPAPNEPRAAPLVHTVPLELEGWARILESPACTLEALEVVFQVERGADPRFLDDFFEALAGNESVRLVRITSLLGHEFPADEAQRLARHLKSVLGKKRLNDFELVITCLEESAHDRLECVVGALCRGLSMASPQLARLVLDMNLSGEQVSRVCEALRNCVQVQALHLPHLGCGREGLASVAELLKERPLLALNLAGSWGAKNEDPSSSGISMGSGSGSGSSGCASSTLGTLPLNRCYSSLPRGAPTVYGSLTRPATLPRLPLGLGPVPMPSDRENGSKRNSDSVLCHRLPLVHPLPSCDLSSHQGTGFHEIFSAIREPSCKLRSLNVSKCLLGSLDAGCLAETIRRARHLDALRAAGASRPADMMPLVLAVTEAPCLQLLDLASPRLALDDHPSRLLCHALARNSTLKLLSLEGWTFRIEESDSLSVFSELLRCTSVRELSLCNARLHLAVHEGPLSRLGRRDDAGAELLRAAAPPACPAIVFLRLAGFQVTVNDRLALRGPLLLPFLGGFTALSELDLSLDKSTIGGSSGSLLFIDDKILTNFFGCLSSNFKTLQSLRINFWRITLEDCDRTMRHISKYLKLCNLSFLKMNGLIVTDSVKKVQIEQSFLQTIVTNLHYLAWLCLDGIELTEAQSTAVGKCVRDRFPGSYLEISAKDINVRSVKALVAAVEDGGRAEVVYTGGTHCRLRISKVQKNGKNKKK